MLKKSPAYRYVFGYYFTVFLLFSYQNWYVGCQNNQFEFSDPLISWILILICVAIWAWSHTVLFYDIFWRDLSLPIKLLIPPTLTTLVPLFVINFQAASQLIFLNQVLFLQKRLLVWLSSGPGCVLHNWFFQ